MKHTNEVMAQGVVELGFIGICARNVEEWNEDACETDPESTI